MTHPRTTRINRVELGNVDSVEVMCCGDTHFGSPDHVRRMSLFVEQWVAESRDRYVVFAGDLLDAATESSVSDTYKADDPQLARDIARRWVINVDSGIGDGRHHIIAAVEGNHDDRYARETGLNVTASIFHDLEIPFGMGKDDHDGYISVTALSVGQKHGEGERRRPIIYTMLLHHGVGGGGTVGARANMLNKLPGVVSNADIYVCGHTHMIDHNVRVNPKIDHGNNTIIEQEQCMVMVPGMIRGGYATKKALPPLATTRMPVITLSGTEKSMTYSEVAVS